MKITFEQNSEAFMVLIDDTIHIFLKKESFDGITTIDSNDGYYIYFHSNGSKMETRYTDKYIWEDILNILKDNL